MINMEKVLTKIIENILIVTLNDPNNRNAVDFDMANELEKIWINFEKNDNLNVAIITGSGNNFSAGANLYDVKRLLNRVENPNGPLGFTRLIINKPVIAAINGYCVAGGLEIALWADIRVAGKNSKFGFLERRFGVPLIDGGTQRLPKIIGLGRALDLILTGKLIDAQEAYQIGLINYLVEDDEVLNKSIEIAKMISSFPQNTLRNDRLSVYEGLGRRLSDGLNIEMKYGIDSIKTNELINGSELFKKGLGRHGEIIK